ncbi:uncharacterized protein I303_104613 [Kwoniella dejecticola CBS 10117]|uniref:PIN domain-containing protein n=1 Tax=Kwoniella dejecticola CBS 10117 TaxID=1296121 RepID=A0A1A6A4W6_9TREE|nr:uncharacterized protein I303_04409 [Kwoniella dejecticola CBS 10117]OBR85078.1 hypothetical protein I303_04409 [Kwoniella dejecticola CBS 10117]
MEDPTPIAGPSRPRRPVDNTDIANKIFALQRKNAAAVGNGMNDPTSSRRTEASERERPRQRLPQIGVLPPAQTNRPSPLAPPLSPSRSSGHPRHPSSPRRAHTSLRPPAEIDEFFRGPNPHASASRALFDPSRPANPPLYHAQAPARSPRPTPSPVVVSSEDERPRRRVDSRRLEGSSSSGPKKLFDPSIHDPMHFSPRPTVTTPDSFEVASASSSRLLLRKPIRTPEEEADRERERRKRREGSERGSQLNANANAKRKDSDTRSKGSRSSEGSESLKDRDRGKSNSDTGVKPILKKIHDEIKDLEAELVEVHRQMSNDPEAGISILPDGMARNDYSRSRQAVHGDREAAAWIDLIAKHKHLAELHDHFLITLFDPLVPSSYHQLSVKYNIPSRLWQTAFHLLLERLRLAWMSGHPTAMDLLTDVVYDAYRFYSELLENQGLSNFRTAWIEALGDLARYRMTIASYQEAPPSSSSPKGKARLGRIDQPEDQEEDIRPEPSGASIGAEVAQNWDVEDKETWRTTARDWYNMGINEKPGEGRLHHHLALLCRDVKGQQGRALHHFVKSLTVTHEYPTSRESILPLFDSALQNQRSLPEATAMDLFLRLHGMLFTRISLDDFEAVMSRYMERLEEDARLGGVSQQVGIGQTDWMIMASVCLGSIMQYGSSSGIVRKALSQEGAERRRAQAMAENDDGEEDGENGLSVEGVQPTRTISPMPMNGAIEEEQPITFTYALKLSFAVFEFVLAHPNRIQGFHQILNPYITIFLTFLATLFRQPHVGSQILLSIPWERLVQFVNSANVEITEEKRLASGIPLPEDWLLRGNEWVGRRVYERGFWKTKSHSGSGRGSSGGIIAQPRQGAAERFSSEMDVLLANFEPAQTDLEEGVIDEEAGDDGPAAIHSRRWKRVIWATGVLLKYVDGLTIDPANPKKLVISGTLRERMDELQRQKEKEIEEDRRTEKRRIQREREQEMEFALEELEVEIAIDSDNEDEDKDEELAALRNRKKELQGLLQHPSSSNVVVQPKKSRMRQKNLSNLQIVHGYTMLLFDTNVLVDSLELFSKIVESGMWSVIVPLPVITELDGLSKEPGPLGENSKRSIKYLESHIRSHNLNLKVQTSKGNYLNDLSIRTELSVSGRDSVDDTEDIARTMDDKIVNIANFANENFMDRSGLLKRASGDASGKAREGSGADKVIVISNDRNLRLMVRSKGLKGVDEKELQRVLVL